MEIVLKTHRDKLSIEELIGTAEQRASASSEVSITQFRHDEGYIITFTNLKYDYLFGQFTAMRIQI